MQYLKPGHSLVAVLINNNRTHVYVRNIRFINDLC